MTCRIERRPFLQGLSLTAVSLVTSGLTSGCRPQPPRPVAQSEPLLPPYHGPLVPPSEIPGNFVWQQRVHAKHGDESGAFDAVLQKVGPELLVVGLTPFGTRGFSLRQVGKTHEFQKFIPFDLPFSPKAVLIDIHRAFFFQVTHDNPPARLARHTFEGEQVEDEFVEGHLKSRRYERVSGTDGSIFITYSGRGYLPYQPPAVTKLDNRAYGYTLRVETSSVTPLE